MPMPGGSAPTALTVESRFPAVSRPELGSHPSEVEIERFARARHGILTVADLRALGLSERAIRHRAAIGRLHRLHRGIYAVDRPTVLGRWTAALLACGPRAVLSHASASALWGLSDDAASVHVTVPRSARDTRTGIVVHGSVLEPSEITRRDAIASTSVARTLLDLAATTDQHRVERAVDRAEELRLFDLGELSALLDRRRGERGVRVLTSILAEYDGPEATQSAAEERLLTLIERARVPRPALNVWIPLPEGGGYRPDFLWAERQLIVEVDGRTYHARRRAFEHDRRRDRRLSLAGYETHRYAAREVLRQPRAVVTELRAFLAGGPSA